MTSKEVVETKNRRRYIVAQADELAEGERKIVSVNGREIGIFNVNGAYYAVRNRCPHRGAPLCRGRTSALSTSTEVGQVEQSRHGEILKCPWHLWDFDLTSGQAIHDPQQRVRAYQVKVEGNEVALYLH